MKYLCLIYVEENGLREMPNELVAAITAECLDYTEELHGNGRLLAAARLESVQTATTVRTRAGKLLVTDGPFAETKEQLAGFQMIEARDLNEAIGIAAKMPSGRLGCIEVRPVAARRSP